MLLLCACRFDPDPRDDAGRRIFRIGYLTNLTHAPALVGFEAGIFERELGPDVVVEALSFHAGPSIVEALFAGELDVAYVGPNPAINAYVRSRGRALRIIAGSTSGGAALIAQPEIERVEELVGQTVASPALANTQDIALRTFLEARGLETTEQGGTVRLMPVAPSDILLLFRRDELAAAWVPEPWASRLVIEAGGRVLVDEATLWPDGRFPTTVVIAATPALERRPDLVQRFVAAHEEALAFCRDRPEEARRLAAARILRETRVALPSAVVKRAFYALDFESDPLEGQLATLASRAHALGFLPSERIEGILDRRFAAPSRPARPN